LARQKLTPQRNRLLIQRAIGGAILLTGLMALGGILFGTEGTVDRMSCMLPIAFVLSFGFVYSIQFGIEMNRPQ